MDESDPEEDGVAGARRRAQWQSHRELSLEESWSSLNLFNKSQMGRISANINADIVGKTLLTTVARFCYTFLHFRNVCNFVHVDLSLAASQLKYLPA